jgi:L-aspartate oxidase
MDERLLRAAKKLDCEWLVIGAGLAGLYTALGAAHFGRVCLLTKSSLSETNSAWAQGGIAAAMDENDSPQLHFEDTLATGHGLCNARAVEVLVREGPDCIRELDRLGVAFDRGEKGYALGREGGHNRRRIVHAGGSSTGARIVERLSQFVLNTPNIELIEQARVIALLAADGTCYGARIFERGQQIDLRARVTILATGGAGALYARTTNPPGATGDGIALAYRAGAELADLEFIQFHPTALAVPDSHSFLISEAVRGEGAYLLNEADERFMPNYDDRAELAPRDVVARAIFAEIRKSDTDHVYLSLSHLKPDLIRQRFANISQMLMNYDLDLAHDQIPVAPAAHYTIGGVRTDLNAQTTIKNLYAVGEVASTGVHGANRLASNSLLECLVFARRAAGAISATCADHPDRFPMISSVSQSGAETVDVARQSELAQLMTEYVGLMRDRQGLEQALKELQGMERAGDGPLNDQVLVARLIAQSALLRTETRGVHARRDFPNENPDWSAHIVVQKDQEPRVEQVLSLTEVKAG